jgi:hypothetical protein
MHAGPCMPVHACSIACSMHAACMPVHTSRVMYAGPCMPVHASCCWCVHAHGVRTVKKCKVNLGSKRSGWSNIPDLVSTWTNKLLLHLKLNLFIRYFS